MDKICLVQLSFEQDSVEGTLFCKKVRICGFPLGIESVSNGYIKQISYPHLSNSHGSRTSSAPTNLASLATRKCGGSANFQRQTVRFANLSYPRIDLDLARSLERFTVIVVPNQHSSDFISYYVNANTVIINIENSLAAMMGSSENDPGYTHSQQTQTGSDDDLHTVRIQIDDPGDQRDSVSGPASNYDNCNRRPRRPGTHHNHQTSDYAAHSAGVDVCDTGRPTQHRGTSNNTRQSYITTASTYLH